MPDYRDYYQRKQPRMAFDIETAVNPENLQLMQDPKPAANLRDPVKIAADIAEKKAAAIEMAALDPDYGRVLSIGYATDPNGPIRTMVVGEPMTSETDNQGNKFEFGEVNEADVIYEFWRVFADCNGHCVGYNILGFDLPYLLRRSMALGVKVPLIPNLAKFRTEPVTDLMAILYNWGGDRYKGLKQVAKLYGIPNDCPDVDGSKVASLDPETLRAYQASDVKLVIELYKRMNGVYFSH